MHSAVAAGGPAGAHAHAHARGQGLRLAGAPHVAVMVELQHNVCGRHAAARCGQGGGKAVYKLVRMAAAQQLPWAARMLSLMPSPIHLQERQVARCDRHAAHECAHRCAQDHAPQYSLPAPPLPPSVMYWRHCPTAPPPPPQPACSGAAGRSGLIWGCASMA